MDENLLLCSQNSAAAELVSLVAHFLTILHSSMSINNVDDPAYGG